MTYEILLEVMDDLKEDLENYIGMLDTDRQIIENRGRFPQVCPPDEIVENYVEELQDILQSLKNLIQTIKIFPKRHTD